MVYSTTPQSLGYGQSPEDVYIKTEGRGANLMTGHNIPKMGHWAMEGVSFERRPVDAYPELSEINQNESAGHADVGSSELLPVAHQSVEVVRFTVPDDARRYTAWYSDTSHAPHGGQKPKTKK